MEVMALKKGAARREPRGGEETELAKDSPDNFLPNVPSSRQLSSKDEQ